MPICKIDDSESVAIQSCRGLLRHYELRFDGLESVGCSLSGSVVGAVSMDAGRGIAIVRVLLPCSVLVRAACVVRVLVPTTTGYSHSSSHAYPARLMHNRPYQDLRQGMLCIFIW